MSDGSKSVVGPIYWLYRSFCRPSVLFSNVGPPILAMSSISELVAPVLDTLDSVGLLFLSSVLSGDLLYLKLAIVNVYKQCLIQGKKWALQQGKNILLTFFLRLILPSPPCSIFSFLAAGSEQRYTPGYETGTTHSSSAPH